MEHTPTFEQLPKAVATLTKEFSELKALLLKKAEPTPEQQPDDLITREEALKYLRVTGATLWRYEKQGKIQSYGMGAKRYFKSLKSKQV